MAHPNTHSHPDYKKSLSLVRFAIESVAVYLASQKNLQWKFQKCCSQARDVSPLSPRCNESDHALSEHMNFDAEVIDFGNTKTGEHSMPMHRELKAYLLRHRKKSGYVIPEEWVNRESSSLSLKFKIEAGKAGVANALFHQLRHTFNTALALGGVEKRHSMEIIGHDSEAVHDAYTHVTALQLKSELEKLNLRALQGQKIIVPQNLDSEPENVVRLAQPAA